MGTNVSIQAEDVLPCAALCCPVLSCAAVADVVPVPSPADVCPAQQKNRDSWQSWKGSKWDETCAKWGSCWITLNE